MPIYLPHPLLERAVVESAILCDGVTVKSGAHVSRGSILSFGVVVGAGVVVPPFTRITLSTTTDDDNDFGEDEGEVSPQV